MFPRSWLDYGSHLHRVTPPLVPFGKSLNNALEPAGMAWGEYVKDRNRRVRHGLPLRFGAIRASHASNITSPRFIRAPSGLIVLEHRVFFEAPAAPHVFAPRFGVQSGKEQE